jgi:ribA/ribD-fused uncharacterized protein
MKKQYIFFWKGILSQWSKSPFVKDGVLFNCAEQYMMFKKADFFGDEKTANEILKTSLPSEQQLLGRKVKGFNQDNWDSICFNVVYDGNMAKFTQNKEHLVKLFSSGNKTLVEASPIDRIWGIGFAEHEALANIENWGQNLLGQVLTKVRNDLFKDPSYSKYF